MYALLLLLYQPKFFYWPYRVILDPVHASLTPQNVFVSVKVAISMRWRQSYLLLKYILSIFCSEGFFKECVVHASTIWSLRIYTQGSCSMVIYRPIWHMAYIHSVHLLHDIAWFCHRLFTNMHLARAWKRIFWPDVTELLISMVS